MNDDNAMSPDHVSSAGNAMSPDRVSSAGNVSSRLLFILADDHRDSLEKELYKLTAAPTGPQAARIRADKMLVYEALVEATKRLPDAAQAGILVDEEYGSDVAALAAKSDGRITLSMPLEASGKDWFEFAYGEDWKTHAGYFATDHAKVLIRDNPSLSVPDRLQQAERLRVVSAWAAETRHQLIVELIVPATDADLASVGGDKKRYDDELRLKLTLDVIGFLQDHGADPALWKIEGLDSATAAAAVADLAGRGGRAANCIILGRHASKEDLDHWLEVAAPLPGYVGFAIGRSIWWDALAGHLTGAVSVDAAQQQIAENYLGYAHDYLNARAAAAVR
jgi:myo-inositol catabolism protein IolC